jgi:hypothetical protein
MPDLWYYTSEGRQMEPVSTSEIQQLAKRGLLKPTDMVWRDGMPRWVRASAASEIFPAGAASFERADAPSAHAPSAKPRNPVDESAPVMEPLVLDPVPEGAADAPREEKKRRPDVDERVEKRRPRRPGKGRERHTPIIVLVGLLLGGGLLLVVLLLGMFFIILTAR